MILLPALFVFALMPEMASPFASAQADGLQRAVAAVEVGDLEAALRAAQSEADPLRRAQALFHVRHHAGDLGGAYRAGLEGLEAAPLDPWLLERLAYVALTLRDPVAADAFVARLEQAGREPGLTEAESARWRSIAADHRAEARAIARALSLRDRARVRARGVVIAVLGAALLALIVFARSTGTVKTAR